MKRFLIAVLAMAVIVVVAESGLAQGNPRGTAKISVGSKTISVEYGRPSLKRRSVADLLQQQPAAIFINPVNWEGIKGTLIEAKRKNVPVIIVDAPVSDPDLVLCQVASDNVEAGRLACEALAKVRPEKV